MKFSFSSGKYSNTLRRTPPARAGIVEKMAQTPT
jgi:hypothetical protein